MKTFISIEKSMNYYKQYRLQDAASKNPKHSVVEYEIPVSSTGATAFLDVYQYIPFIDRGAMIKNIIASVFLDGRYHYGFEDSVIDMEIIRNYTNVKTLEMKTEDLYKLARGTDIMDKVKLALGEEYNSIVREVKSAIEYEKQKLAREDEFAKKKAANDNLINSLLENISALVGKLNATPEYTDEDLADAITVGEKVAEMDSNKVAAEMYKAMLMKKIKNENEAPASKKEIEDNKESVTSDEAKTE